MKLLASLFLLLGMLFNQYAVAEEHPFIPYTVRALSIKLSNDRTGIIKDVGCNGCNFKTVNITSETKAYKDGVEVDLLEAKMRAGKPALVSFNPETREVQTIRWTE